MLPIIDNNICTRCGACVSICPKKVLEMTDDGVTPVLDDCILCSHCYCVCPVEAVSFSENVLKKPAFTTFSYNEELPEPGAITPAALINDIRSRRSARQFSDRPLSDEAIRDLLEFAVTAPSGSNRQEWNFTVVNGRDKVWKTAGSIKKFFEKINAMARNPLIRYLSVPFMGTALIRYYRDNYQSVCTALEESEKGIDRLFHGAPALVIVHGPREGSTPFEDAQFASYNMTLLAHHIGIGTCYIGYATNALNRAAGAKAALKIPKSHRIYTVLALGYAKKPFRRPALRKPFPVDWI